MLFTEKNGTRKNFAKDPAVVKFGGRYFLYYSSYYKGVAGKEVLGIGIAASEDLDHFEAVSTVPLRSNAKRTVSARPLPSCSAAKCICFIRLTATAGGTPSATRSPPTVCISKRTAAIRYSAPAKTGAAAGPSTRT